MNDKSFLSIIVPTLNEEHYVSQALLSLTPNSDRFDYEIIVVDGGSTDRTVAIVRGLSKTNSNIKLVHNEKRLQAAAINIGAQLAHPRAEVLIRADCHAAYPERFAELVYDALQETGASSVVVPMITTGSNCWQTAIAAAQNSRLGNGGSLHRLAQSSRWVEHGHHAAFRRETFAAIGGYDETFSHNEDAEFDIRNVQAGGTIWMECKAAVQYFPRSSLRKLGQQYFKHGAGRAKTYRKHHHTLRLRQLLPVVVLLTCVASLLVAPIFLYALAIPLLYVAACIAFGGVIGMQQRSLCIAGSGIAAIVMHISWAVGFIKSLISSHHFAYKTVGSQFDIEDRDVVSEGSRVSGSGPPEPISTEVV